MVAPKKDPESYDVYMDKLDLNWAVSCLESLSTTAERLRHSIRKKHPRRDLAKKFDDMMTSVEEVRRALKLDPCDCRCHRPSEDYLTQQAKESADKKYKPLVTAAKAVRDAFMRSGSAAAGVEANKRLVPVVERLESGTEDLGGEA